jgi:Domain of unknown function (DUF4340)
MNFKTTYILFGLLACFFLVVAYVLWTGPTPPPGSGFILPSMHQGADPLAVSAVDRVVIDIPADKDQPATSITLERNPDTKNWAITAPVQLPADNFAVTSLIERLHDAEINRGQKPISMSDAGLKEPKRTITLFKGQKSVKVDFGASTAGADALIYVLSSDTPGTPLAVRKGSVEQAIQGIDAYRAHDLLGTSDQALQEIKLTSKKGTIELKKTPEGWRMVQPPYGEVDIEQLTSHINDLKVEYRDDKHHDFAADGVSDRAKYNLDPAKQSVLTIAVKRGESGKETTYTLLIGVEKKVPGSEGKEENRYYATTSTNAKTFDVVRVPAPAVAPFLSVLDDPNSVRNKAMVTALRPPDAIVIENSYGKLEFLRDEPIKPWQLYRDGKGNPVDPLEMQRLLSELTKKDAAQSFPDPMRKKELGLDGKQDTVVKVYADAVEKPVKADEKDKKEPKSTIPTLSKDAKPVATLRFGNREKGMVAVERIVGSEDRGTLLLVPESVLDIVRRGPLAYMDKTVSSFAASPLEVTKLTVETGGTTTEATREKSTEPWKLVKPDRLKGREANALAIENILMQLTHLKATELVSEKAEPSDLANYGLQTPSSKVVVTRTKDGKPATQEYAFGKEAGKGVYLKLGDRGTIYLVDSGILTILKKDLLDPTVMKFARTDVEAVKLTGWKKVLGGAETRTLEFKDAKWSIKEKPAAAVDSAKVDAFLASLANLQAEKFVSTGKELSVDQNGLEIEITLKGSKEPLQLLVGGQEGTSVYASSKQLKDEVFLVPGSIFEGPRSQPGYFTK